MRSGLEERRERGSFGLSTAVGQVDDQRLKGVGFLSGGRISAKVCPAMPPLRSELTRVFRPSGAQLPIPTELLAGCRQFAPAPSLGTHKWRYPQNSKTLPTESNSSKRGLTVRGMFAPSGRPWRSCAQPGSPASETDHAAFAERCVSE
jgi:hypothetical protein